MMYPMTEIYVTRKLAEHRSSLTWRPDRSRVPSRQAIAYWRQRAESPSRSLERD